MTVISDRSFRAISDPAELEYLATLRQFWHIPNELLFRIVRVGTGWRVTDRFAAIKVILARQLPIPVL